MSEPEKVKLNRWCGKCRVRCGGEKCPYCGETTDFPGPAHVEMLEGLEEARLKIGGEQKVVGDPAFFQKLGKIKGGQWMQGTVESMKAYFLATLERLEETQPKGVEERVAALKAFLRGWSFAGGMALEETERAFNNLRGEFPDLDKRAREVLMEKAVD